MAISLDPETFVDPPIWRCREPKFIVGPTGDFTIVRPCRRWKCPECRPWLIKRDRWKVTFAFHHLGGTHLFVLPMDKKVKPLSNYIQRHGRGLWVCVRTIEGGVAISTRQFDGVKGERRYKEKYLDVDLLELLSSPWLGGKRVSCSREVSNLWRGMFSDGLIRGGMSLSKISMADIRELSKNWITKPKDERDRPSNWAEIPYEKELEYLELDTKLERALWLSDPKNVFKLYKAGKEFIEETLRLVPPQFRVISIGKRTRNHVSESSEKEVWLEG